MRSLGPQSLRVTDKLPRNFELLWLPRLAVPRARIIHCRRHPIDTCLSNYFTNFWSAQEYAWDRGDLVFFYRQYERLMDHWRRVLPSDRFTEVDYEALVADREAETRRLVAFLGLDWNDALPRPGAEHAACRHREQVAGTPAGLQDVGRALEAIRVMARGIARTGAGGSRGIALNRAGFAGGFPN